MKIGIIAGVIMFILGAGAYVITQQKDNSGNSTSTTSSETTDTTHGSAEEHGHSSEEHEAVVSASVDDACSVFDASEFSAVLGLGFEAGSSEGYTPQQNSDNMPNRQCDWDQNGADDIDEFNVHLDTYSYASEDKAKQDLQDSRISAGSLTYEEVTEVGDEAIYARSGAEGAKKVRAAIYWRKGTVVYHLTAVKLAGLEVPTVESQLKTIVSAKF